MDFRSFIEGILVAYGVVNLLAVFKIALYIAMPVIIFGVDMGNILLSLLALGVAYLLLRG